MKILHTSDWHLGISINNVSLLKEQQQFIKDLSHVIRVEKIDAVVLAGDVFDHAVSRPEAIALYNEAVTLICKECNTPLLICAGNHDGAARLSACNALLVKSGLYIIGNLREAFSPILIGDAAFYLLPYFTLEEARYVLESEYNISASEIKNYPQAMEIIVEKMKENFPKDKKNILVAHCFVRDAVLSESDTAARVGGSSMVPAEVFSNFDYVALGHLHMPQFVGNNVRYSGSPLKYSFGEARQEKSFSVLDTDDMEQRETGNVKIKEIPVMPLRNMQVLKDTLDNLLDIAQARKYMNNNRDDYIKIEITDDFAVGKLELFRSYYPNLLCLSGKAVNAEDQQVTLTVTEVSTLSPSDILKRFYEEIVGETVDEELLHLFEKAGEAL